MSNCPFCSISKDIKNQTHIFLESEHSFAIPDLYPLSKGHTLIITKEHHKNLMVCPEQLLMDAIALTKKTAEKLMQLYPEIKGIRYMSNQEAPAKQVIFHLHIHVIPVY